MNSRNLVKKIVQLYQSARNPLYKNNKILRGRSRSISSQTEDLFAYFLIKKLEIENIYIDQPININGKITYPDLVIKKHGEIIAFLDIKMDVGFMRDEIFGLCKNKAEWIGTVRDGECKLRHGISKKESFIHINKKAFFGVVIISDKNVSQKIFKAQIDKVQKFDRFLDVYVLTGGIHPNTYMSLENVMSKISINERSLERLLKKINQI